MTTDSQQQDRIALLDRASYTPYWSLVLAQAWVQGMAQGQVPFQVHEASQTPPSIGPLPEPDSGPRAGSLFQQRLQLAALSWDIALQSRHPEKVWTTHYRREDYPALVPVRIPGTVTSGPDPDPLLIICPSHHLMPMLQAASSLLHLRPCDLSLAHSGEESLYLPIGTWISIVQGHLLVQGVIPLDQPPAFPLTHGEDFQTRQSLDGFNQAYQLAKAVLPQSPLWFPVPRDPRHPWEYD